MKKTVINSIKYLPFTLIISLHVFIEYLEIAKNNMQLIMLVFLALVIINFISALVLKVKDYFLSSLTGVSIVGTFLLFFVPKYSQLFIENTIAIMYFGLLLVTIIPPIFKLKLFTYQFSEKNYPSSITKGEQFYKINLILNFIWAFLFAMAIVFTLINYSDNKTLNAIISTIVPIALLLIVGIPVTKYLPEYLMQVIGGKQIKFTSINDLFIAMPFGLNKAKAKGINVIVQFYLTGKELTTGFLTINNQKCTYNNGIHKKPTTIIRSDSQLWLHISNNEVSGEKALINNEYTIEGDASIMLKFADMFKPTTKTKNRIKPKPISYDYKHFKPQKIKNIVVFDGGYRSDKNSKTSFMVNHFISGVKEAGASVDYIKLKDYYIKDCTGCYSCWTKSPGECIFDNTKVNDDMSLLRKKFREANLVAFASPLYIFNVSGILKTFMDRLLPILKPYMIVNDKGNIMHPDRYPEKGKQGFVVFSAAGFPEVAHNFNGLIGMFRAWNSHNENSDLMGEFYLPASEMIVQPIYKERKELIKDLCIKAGKQIINNGYIDKQIMNSIQDPLVSKESFQQQANAFWESLDGKKSYMANVPKLH